ncbi:MAG: DNA polymerase, partial [SAR324 cluster bacterium]|nr:DNA polymerase [SAR324 cluster bacterium]
MQLHLDVETRSSVELRTCGVYKYAQHPHSDVWCVCFATPDRPEPRLWLPSDKVPHEITEVVEDGGTLHAWNANFERIIWKFVLGPRYGWPEPDLTQWRCSMAEARAFGLPGSLKNAAVALNVEHLKDAGGTRLMQRMARARRWDSGEPVWWDSDPEKLERLHEYCKQDVRAELALSERIPPLCETELQTYRLDQIVNDRGITVDRKLVAASQAMVAAADQRINAKLQSVTGIYSTNAASRITSWIKERGVKCDSLKKDAVASMLNGQIPDDVRQVLELRQEGAKTSTAKLRAYEKAVCPDGRLRGSYQFHGAGTGRWAGRLVQIQNLPRCMNGLDVDAAIDDVLAGNLDRVEERHGRGKDVVSSLLRAMLKSPDEKELVGADFASIEARVLAWLAGEAALLQAFRSGEDVYRKMAASIFGCSIEEVTKERRQLGKMAVLGCGYQMGHKRFREQCLAFGIKIGEYLAGRVVTIYRETNSEIVGYWAMVEEAAKRTAFDGSANKAGPVTCSMEGSVLRLKLPSGRCICYQQPKVEQVMTSWGELRPQLTHMHQNSVTQRWERTPTYGGRLVENITQAVARDLLVAAMFRLEHYSFRICAHIHDEVVAVPTFQMSNPVRRMEELMIKTPPWAEGLPVAAEAWKGKRYLK